MPLPPTPAPEPAAANGTTAPVGHCRDHLVDRHPWLPLVIPMAVYLLTGLIEPDLTSPRQAQAPPGQEVAEDREEVDARPTPDDATWRWSYPLAYTVRLVATLVAIGYFWPTYRRIPFRLSPAAGVAGVIGVALWIGICRWGLERRIADMFGIGGWIDWGARAGFDPFAAFADSPATLVVFLAVRFLGLVLVVPLIEEIFLRGFLMRFFLQADWWTIPLGTVTWGAAGVATLYGVLSHPAEPLAAAVWFSWITLLYARTRNIWDCVAAHAVTNGLLGVYILIWRHWELW